MKVVHVVVALLVASIVGTVWAGLPRGVQANAGLFVEQRTEVDGVRVTRIRDTATGAICYVAINVESMHNGGAISCLK